MNRNFLLGVLLLAFVCYGISLNHPLLWDDEATVVQNVLIRNLRNLPLIFTSGYHAGAGEVTNLYRPLATVSLMADYHLWRLNPIGFHLTNLLLHLMNLCFLYKILKKLLPVREKIAGITLLLFAIHPINSEVVNYVSCRTELLMAFFLLAGFYGYLLYRQNGRRLFLGFSLLAFLGSLFSKEMGILFPWVLFIYEVLLAPRRQLKGLLGFLGIAVFYFFLRATALNFLGIPFWKGAQAEPFSDNLWIRLLTAAKIHWIYIQLLFVPTHLHLDRDVPIALLWYEPLGIAAMAGILWFLLLGWFLRRRQPLLSFGIFWYFGGLAPISNFLPLNTAIAEHYLYLPSIGFFLTVAVGLEIWGQRPFFAKILCQKGRCPHSAVLLVLMGLTISRTLEWGDEEKLYLSTVKNTRYSFRANNNLGVYYFRNNQMDKAEEYFKRSLEILPTYAEALNNIGAVCQRKGDLLGAIAYYQKSVQSNPNYLLAHENLLALYRYLERKEEAEKEEEALRSIHLRLGFPPNGQLWQTKAMGGFPLDKP